MRVALTDRVFPGGHHGAMTRAHSSILSSCQPGFYHCVTRCVRRSWLCGVDPLAGVDDGARKAMLEARIMELGSIFALGIYSFAVMSNQVHVVLSVEPDAASQWGKEAVVDRWLRLFPARQGDTRERELMLKSAIAIETRRQRLTDISWFMRCLDEHAARRANAEGVKRRFYEGRFKCQRLEDEQALLAAMVFVDLNPVRAGVASNVEGSDHTSVQRRTHELRSAPERANSMLMPIAGFGVPSARKIAGRLAMNNRQYIELVEYTGRLIKKGKRGKNSETVPPALRRLGLNGAAWSQQVKGIGGGHCRVVASAGGIVASAFKMGKKWLKRVVSAFRSS